MKPFKAGKVSKKNKNESLFVDPRESHSPIRLETSIDTESDKNGTATKFYNSSPKFRDDPQRSSSVPPSIPEAFKFFMHEKVMKSSLVKGG